MLPVKVPFKSVYLDEVEDEVIEVIVTYQGMEMDNDSIAESIIDACNENGCDKVQFSIIEESGSMKEIAEIKSLINEDYSYIVKKV